MKIHNYVFSKDIKKCIKKRWYPGIELEIKSVIKFLSLNKSMPGEYPMHGFQGKLAGRILHAKIVLKDFNVGKRKGPRIAYYIPIDSAEEVKVLYVGGHKDAIYEKAEFCSLITSRYLDDETLYYSADEFLALF